MNSYEQYKSEFPSFYLKKKKKVQEVLTNPMTTTNVATREQILGVDDYAHYNGLYSCKHFRNRVIRVQQLCLDSNIDAILIITGMDSRHDGEMRKILNWLVWGFSGPDVSGESHSFTFDDSFFVVGKDSLQVYTTQAGYEHLQVLTTLVSNCSVYVLDQDDEENQERVEVLKIAKFYELVHDKPVIGMAVQTPIDEKLKGRETQIVETWPLIQAYGLDYVGNGFFTMKHKWVNIREKMIQVYKDLDSFSLLRIVFYEVVRLNKSFAKNFETFNRITPEKRLEQSPQQMVNEFFSKSDLQNIQRLSADMPEFSDGFPKSRICVGQNETDSFDAQHVSSQQSLIERKESSLHMTLEHVEPNNGMRFARTYFLSALASDGFMKGVFFKSSANAENEPATSAPCDSGLQAQSNTKTLLFCYLALVKAHNELSKGFMCGKISVQQLSQAFNDLYLKALDTQGVNVAKAFPAGVKASVNVLQYDCLGMLVEKQERVNQKCVVAIRITINKIVSEHQSGAQSLGSILYANSYVYFDEVNHICLTEGVPTLQQWYTSPRHYQHLAKQQALQATQEQLECDLLGKVVDTQKDCLGFMPVKAELQSVIKRDIMMFGKVSFHERGLMYTDERLGVFVVPFASTRHFTVHKDSAGVSDWLQVTMNQQEGKNMLPAGLIADECFYIRLKNIDKHFNALKAQIDACREADKDAELPTLEKSFDNKCDRLRLSFSMKNFNENEKLYDAKRGSDFANFSFRRQEYRELFDFQSIQEFNLLKGKVFVPFSQFVDVYREVANKPKAIDLESTKDQLAQKLRRESQAKPISMVLVSGIPGSGKGRLANSIAKLLLPLQLKTAFFKMPTVQQSVKYSTADFVKALIEEKYDPAIDVMVAALPSYHHLKKAIFELRKSEEFTQKFDIKFVVTKVSANNFFQNDNRNLYNFLIENCIKGVCNAVIFETSQLYSRDDIFTMQKILRAANFEEGLLSVHTRYSFDLELLSQILMRQNEKFNMLYTKYFYGFEKEGATVSYREGKAIQGHYIQYKYPILETAIDLTLQKAINFPIADASILLPKSQAKIDAERIEAEELEKRIAAMDSREKRKYEAEKRKKERLEADLESERLLKQQIDIQKKIVASAQPGKGLIMIERLRGLVRIENGDTDQDYQLTVTNADVSLRPMKNHKNRLNENDYGFLAYGRNLPDNSEELLREVLKTCRTQLRAKQNMRQISDLSKDEIQAIVDARNGECLPDGWYFSGRFYVDQDGQMQEEHPGLETLLKQYLGEANEGVGEYNRQVQKEWKEDKQKFE